MSRSKFNHTICGPCFAERTNGTKPISLKNATEEKCCCCGTLTAEGIYIRIDPRTVPCGGVHEEKD